MEERIICAGFGGQGVLLIGQLLALAAMADGKEVSWLPSYGPEMRGGTASCSVILSDEPVGAPVVSEATAAIVMNKPSLLKFEKAVVEGGLLVINSSLIDIQTSRADVRAVLVPANEIALELGNARVANMVMLGAYLQVTGYPDIEQAMGALKSYFGPKKEHLLPINREAIERGMACAAGT